MKGLDFFRTVGNGCISTDCIAGHDEESAAVIHLHLALATTSRREAAAADEVDSVARLRGFRICLHLSNKFCHDIGGIALKVSVNILAAVVQVDTEKAGITEHKANTIIR